ncbi:hypothetical protein C9I57_02905 [Trinickia symbiotica]|uniref:Uncharacterized protein n=1 Tax=Trinickia symbiotica TaxID=863227 RepID=A0A2T3Y1U8_9BURK|nr:hypothetical protein C9I57_02905 [Trinickia symbiotica]
MVTIVRLEFQGRQILARVEAFFRQSECGLSDGVTKVAGNCVSVVRIVVGGATLIKRYRVHLCGIKYGGVLWRSFG